VAAGAIAATICGSARWSAARAKLGAVRMSPNNGARAKPAQRTRRLESVSVPEYSWATMERPSRRCLLELVFFDQMLIFVNILIIEE
jgi:hypothetical protein